MEEFSVCFCGFLKDDFLVKFYSNSNYCKVFKVNDFQEAFKISAFALVLHMNFIDVRKFDIKYRRRLNYSMIIVFSENNCFKKYDRFSNIYLVDEENYRDLDIIINNAYEKKVHFSKSFKFHHNKRIVLDRIYNYIKDKKCFKSLDLVKEFDISLRNVERYLRDIDYLYNIIGYDYVKNEYYICD